MITFRYGCIISARMGKDYIVFNLYRKWIKKYGKLGLRKTPRRCLKNICVNIDLYIEEKSIGFINLVSCLFPCIIRKERILDKDSPLVEGDILIYKKRLVMFLYNTIHGNKVVDIQKSKVRYVDNSEILIYMRRSRLYNMAACMVSILAIIIANEYDQANPKNIVFPKKINPEIGEKYLGGIIDPNKILEQYGFSNITNWQPVLDKLLPGIWPYF